MLSSLVIALQIQSDVFIGSNNYSIMYSRDQWNRAIDITLLSYPEMIQRRIDK